MSKTVGALIGRFQLPELHSGHRALIQHVSKQCDETCVLVGVAPQVSLKNLLPYAAVESMVRGTFLSLFQQRKLHIHPLLDIDGNDLQWSMYIDQFLTALFPGYEIQLWSGRDSFKPYYHGKFRPVHEWYGFNGEIHGTDARDAIMDGDPIDSKDFRAGIVYGLGNYLRNENGKLNKAIRLQEEGLKDVPA